MEAKKEAALFIRRNGILLAIVVRNGDGHQIIHLCKEADGEDIENLINDKL